MLTHLESANRAWIPGCLCAHVCAARSAGQMIESNSTFGAGSQVLLLVGSCLANTRFFGAYPTEVQGALLPKSPTNAFLAFLSFLASLPFRPYSGFMCGNSSTSRIDGEFVNSITMRSTPMPSPAVGGMPYSSART